MPQDYTLSGPLVARSAFTITPSDTAVLERVAMGLNCTADTTARVMLAEDNVAVTIQLKQGWNPVSVTRVYATSPTPSGTIVGVTNTRGSA